MKLDNIILIKFLINMICYDEIKTNVKVYDYSNCIFQRKLYWYEHWYGEDIYKKLSTFFVTQLTSN